jgi:hypothetical protein
MPHLPSRRLAMGTSALAALALGITMLGGSSASAGLPTERTVAKARVHKVKVDPRIFGLHDAHLHSLSRNGTGSIRLWDTGVSWAQLQPSGPGLIDWSTPAAVRLVSIVNQAWKNHTEVTYVVGRTPTWASDGSSAFVDGTEPPVPDYYASFLGQLMDKFKNYKGSGRPGIANYQVWNEANIATFWRGTPQQMATLVQRASGARSGHDTRVKLIGPAQVENQFYMRTWTVDFYKLSVGGKKVWKYLDAISLQLYPQETGKPEDSMALYRKLRKMLAGVGVPKTFPVWDTEINYGLVFGGGAKATRISSAKQVAYVMRTYLLSAAAGIKRVDWYSYDMGLLPGGGTLANTLLTSPSDPAAGTLTAAGHAFVRIQSWMKGTLVGTTTKQPCIADRHHTYTCTVHYGTGVGRIYWNPRATPTQPVKVQVVRSASKKVTELGKTTRIKGGSTLKVDYRPVLVKSTQ